MLQEQQKLEVRLNRPDIRSLLFSKGVFFVEGLSDKIVIEQVDRHLSVRHEVASLDESEWSVIDIGGKKSLPRFMTVSRMLGVSCVAILDYDALMCRDSKIEINGRVLKTSCIVWAFWKTHLLKDKLPKKITLIDVPKNEWYDQSHLEELRTQCIGKGIFIFSTDLEGVMQTHLTKNNRKLLKALERIIKLIDKKTIPSEFKEVSEFFRRYALSK